MNDHIEVIKTLTIPDYKVEMCIVSVNGKLFVKSPDFDTLIPYSGTPDLDDHLIEVIMADGYEKILQSAMAEFDRQRSSLYGDLENALLVADNRTFAEQIGVAVASLGPEETIGCMARVMCWIATEHGSAIEFECDLGVVTVEPKKQQLQS